MRSQGGVLRKWVMTLSSVRTNCWLLLNADWMHSELRKKLLVELLRNSSVEGDD